MNTAQFDTLLEVAGVTPASELYNCAWHVLVMGRSLEEAIHLTGANQQQSQQLIDDQKKRHQAAVAAYAR